MGCTQSDSNEGTQQWKQFVFLSIEFVNIMKEVFCEPICAVCVCVCVHVRNVEIFFIALFHATHKLEEKIARI